MLFYSTLRLIVNKRLKRRYYVEIPQLTDIGHLTLITSNTAKTRKRSYMFVPA